MEPTENDNKAAGAPYGLNVGLGMVKDYHPLSIIDNFLLSAGWINDGNGWIAPEKWREAISLKHGGTGAEHWKRATATNMTIQYYEKFVMPNV